MLTRLKIENFKALRNLDISLGGRNVFIGRNNSGKSSILQALLYLTQFVTFGDISKVFSGPQGFRQHLWKGDSAGSVISFQIWGDDNPGADATERKPVHFFYRIDVGLDSQQNLSIQNEILTISPADAVLIETEGGVGTARRLNGEVLFKIPLGAKPVLSYELPGWEADAVRHYIAGWQFFQLIPELSKVSNTPASAAQFLDPQGAQLSAWLHTFQSNYPEAFDRIVSVAKEAFPEIESLATPVTQAGATFLQSKERDLRSPVTIYYASDGEIKFLQLLSIIYSPFNVNLVAVEEPESHLHPRLIELLVEAANNIRIELGDSAAQVFATTHSPFLVDKLDPEDVILVDKIAGATTCVRAKDKEGIKKMLEDGELSFGRLWYSGALGGR